MNRASRKAKRAAAEAEAKAEAEAEKASKNREELLEFLRLRKEQKQKSFLEIESAPPIADEERYRIRPKSPELFRAKSPLPITRDKTVFDFLGREKSGQCPECSITAVDGFPCRVCGKVFHEKCLLKTASLRKEDLDLQLAQAHTNIGWSCPKCDNISTLLSQKELSQMMEDFDSLDINKDSGITLEEYINIKKREFEKLEGHPVGDLDILRIKAQFRCMDSNGDGNVAWWEFVKQETCKVLAKKPRGELVKLLTDKEIGTAQQLFDIFDDDRDGRISEFAVKKAYRSWYGRLTANLPSPTSHTPHPHVSRPRSGSAVDTLDDPSIRLHVELHSQMVLGEAESRLGVITWDDFIHEQALYILCSRPNRIRPQGNSDRS